MMDQLLDGRRDMELSHHPFPPLCVADLRLDGFGDQIHEWRGVHLARTGASLHQVLMLAHAFALRLPQHFNQVCRVRHHRGAFLCRLLLPGSLDGLRSELAGSSFAV